MNLIFLLSVILKGVGSVLEVLIQIVITKGIGVNGYGTYSTWVNAADLVFWCLFSGLVRCNTFYLADPAVSISGFKRRYYLRYVLPVLILSAAAAALLHKQFVSLILAIVLLELLVQDFSSTFMARRRAVSALFGEYVLGRLVLFLGAVLLLHIPLQGETVIWLLWLYLVQFGAVILYFLLQKKRKTDTAEQPVPLKKWAQYQRADVIQSFIGQAPVLVQYAFVGAFEAGVVSIVLLIKKLVNFISGPAAKIFLPEFSRCYHAGEMDGIRGSYASIMRIQMLFVGPMAVVLIGFPKTVLRILAAELTPYSGLFVMCAAFFLVAATLGPSAGLMQMTEHEKQDNRFREAGLLVMLLVFVLMRKNPYFVLFGLCAEAAVESVGKFLFVCRWMGRTPVPVQTYLLWWLLPALAIASTSVLKLGESLPVMLLAAVLVFSVQLYREIKTEHLLDQVRQRLQK